MGAEILLGTQGWSYPDWVGSFYPAGTRPADFLSIYSQAFRTVEVDSTFYGAPRSGMVDGWRRNTPADFRFAAKLPQVITHEKRLVGAQAELLGFVSVMDRLDERLGPLLAQCPPDFHHGIDELRALATFLEQLPPGYEFAVELRHRSWLRPEVYQLLRDHGVAWCIIDLYYMPASIQSTASFSYLRWLGDRRKIERFGEVQIDRELATERWGKTLGELSNQVTRIYGYYNNHYAGHSPASVRLLQKKLGQAESPVPARGLFDP